MPKIQVSAMSPNTVSHVPGPYKGCRGGFSPSLEMRQNWIAELLDPDEKRGLVKLGPYSYSG